MNVPEILSENYKVKLGMAFMLDIHWHLLLSG